MHLRSDSEANWRTIFAPPSNIILQRFVPFDTFFAARCALHPLSVLSTAYHPVGPGTCSHLSSTDRRSTPMKEGRTLRNPVVLQCPSMTSARRGDRLPPSRRLAKQRRRSAPLRREGGDATCDTAPPLPQQRTPPTPPGFPNHHYFLHVLCCFMCFPLHSLVYSSPSVFGRSPQVCS